MGGKRVSTQAAPLLYSHLPGGSVITALMPELRASERLAQTPQWVALLRPEAACCLLSFLDMAPGYDSTFPWRCLAVLVLCPQPPLPPLQGLAGLDRTSCLCPWLVPVPAEEETHGWLGGIEPRKLPSAPCPTRNQPVLWNGGSATF